MRTHFRPLTPVAAVASAVVLAAAGSTYFASSAPRSGYAPPPPLVEPADRIEPAEQASLNAARALSAAFQRATRVIAPSVVNIVSIERMDAPDREGAGGDLWGLFLGPPGRVTSGSPSGAARAAASSSARTATS
jgi:hypothetical protein